MSNTHIILHLAFVLFAGTPALIRGNDFNNESKSAEFAFDHNIVKNSLKFFIHTKDHREGIEFNVNEKSPYIKTNTSTKIIIHGYFSAEDEIQEIVKEYLNVYEDINVITFSWNCIHNMTYLAAADATGFVGDFVLVKEISQLGCKNVLQPHQIHLIGYNLGAHLAGRVAEKLGLKIGRITGLDPSRYCFEVPCDSVSFPGLKKDDAEFVDIIHTSAHIDGLNSPIGTVDFYANGGTFQPACDKQANLNCNSIMSLKYFAESIKSNTNFYGLECSSHIKFLNLECEGLKTVIWTGRDNNVTETSSGAFYFETRAKSPFGLGVRGIDPNQGFFL